MSPQDRRTKSFVKVYLIPPEPVAWETKGPSSSTPVSKSKIYYQNTPTRQG